MLLAVDIGNSNIVFGVFEGDSLLFHFRMETRKARTEDEYAALLHSQFALYGVPFQAAAPDLPAAGALTGRLGRACSRCHEAHGAIVTFAWEPPPDEAPTLAAQMKRHQWAAARLWEGLVGPSEEMWTDGTQTLAGIRLDLAAVTGDTPRGDLAALAGKVRELASRARAVANHDARATLYGELMSTCAGCHQIARPARPR